MEFFHESVLKKECMEGLNLKPNGIYVDCTTGGAGHSEEILRREEIKTLICIDQDSEALSAAEKRLAPFKEKVILVRDNFYNLKAILESLSIKKVDGLLYDLGVSSYQLDNPERGFSYMSDAPLDMRMSRENKKTAKDIVNTYEKGELVRIFRDYGEEKFAREIASKIVRRRSEKEIETTLELSDIIKSALPPRVRYEGGHPAKRVFQAIRIEVNSELSILKDALSDGIDCLNKDGRIVVITFHSLEDRIVKNVFLDRALGCSCPKDFPVCVCGKTPEVKILSRKPILPSAEEMEHNSRAKSAKLRIAEKIKG